jgi:hypothetical protein
MQPSVLPLAAKGVQSPENFRETSVTNPASKCIAPVAPVLMIIPEVKAIEPGSDVIRIRSEGFEGERLVHMNLTSHDTARPTAQGHSIGHWRGDVLVTDTAASAEQFGERSPVLGQPSAVSAWHEAHLTPAPTSVDDLSV